MDISSTEYHRASFHGQALSYQASIRSELHQSLQKMARFQVR